MDLAVYIFFGLSNFWIIKSLGYFPAVHIYAGQWPVLYIYIYLH